MKTMTNGMKGVRVLGRFAPSSLDYETIRREWFLLVAVHGNGYLNIRNPGDHRVTDKSTTRWHHDCGGLKGGTAWVLVWSTAWPTEFKRLGIVWSPQPFDVVLFYNHDRLLCHRRPPIPGDARRWAIVHRLDTEPTFTGNTAGKEGSVL